MRILARRSISQLSCSYCCPRRPYSLKPGVESSIALTKTEVRAIAERVIELPRGDEQ